MSASLLITLRETLEASLVVGIVLAFLNRSGREQYRGAVWAGVGGGVAVSIVAAWLLQTFAGGFSGRAEELYEGFMMLAAAALITWMVLWMLRQGKRLRQTIEKRIEGHVTGDSAARVFLLVFVSVLREGIETVIFLQAAFLQSQAAYHNVGAVLGIVIAIGVSWLLFRGMRFMPLQRFFAVTGVLLVLFAAGLVAHGIHELEEAGVLPVIVSHVWDINPPVVREGVYPLLHENGAVGGLFKGVFGYNGNPSLGEALGYTTYLAAMSMAWRGRIRTKRA